jgi:DNA polymerase-3 subunit delta
MTPQQFLEQIEKKQLAPAYLFLGPEMYLREQCRRALVERMLPQEDKESGFTRHDLADVPFHDVLDDARSFSLFATTRLIWVSAAEAALPRGRSAAAESEEGEEGGKDAPAGALEAYLANPSPGVAVVFDCSRYDFDGEDKAKVERVRKFYAAVRNQVEFPRFDSHAARQLATMLARESGLKIGKAELDLLVDASGADSARIVNEIEKLILFTGGQRSVTEEDLLSLVPDARASTIFALVAALGRSDRMGSLKILDALIRDGEYLPLALAFLGTQCRMALAAKEAKLANAMQIEGYFRKQGLPMWRARAEQIAQTVSAFPKEKLENAISLVYSADKALRDTRPDDRVVMEEFVLRLTG